MACTLPGGWEEGSRALQKHILRSVLHNDFINILEVAIEDTLINLTDDIKVKGIVDILKGRLSTEGTQANWGNGPKKALWKSSRTNARSWEYMGYGQSVQLECCSGKKTTGFCVRQWAGMRQHGTSQVTLVCADSWAGNLLGSPSVWTNLLSFNSEINLSGKITLRNTPPVCFPLAQKWELWLVISPLCWACEIIAFSQHF